jgi:hypothetical protein
LHFPQPFRCSEDIDLVRTESGPIGPVLDCLRDVLEPWLGRALRSERVGTSVTHWTGHIRYKPLAELRAQFVICGGALPLFLNTNLVVAVAVGMWEF